MVRRLKCVRSLRLLSAAFMTEHTTLYGKLVVDRRDALFARAVTLLSAEQEKKRSGAFTVALSGGSTPKDWFQWVVGQRAFSPSLIGKTHFTVSDERMVPLESPESNFGNAERLLFNPLNVPAAHRHPWPVDQPPREAGEAYAETLSKLSGAKESYSVCMLGMGDDAHTASFFPGSPLLEDDGGVDFTAIETATKGWRLTITPRGLRTCGLILVMALGKAKAPALKRVMVGEEEWSAVPAKILSTASDRVVWLVDDDAASQL